MKKTSPIQLFMFVMIIFAFIGFVLTIVFSTILPSPQIETSAYRISDYDISMTVRNDNSISVVENISCSFSDLRKHGIIRALPKVSRVVFQNDNGKTVKKNYELDYSHIDGGLQCEVSDDSEFVYLTLGDEDEFVSENMNYQIRYVVALGDDRIKDFDQFYFNVLGDNWDCKIDSFTAIVNFVKDIPVGVSAFVYNGENAETPIAFSGNSLSYSATNIDAFTPITIRSVLPEGFFTTEKASQLFSYILLGACVLLGVLFIVLFKKKNNHEKPVVTPEFSAPDGITSAEAGYIIDKSIDKQEIPSLIVFWANKKYLRIEEKNKKLTLFKLREPDDKMQDYEKNLFLAIFKNGESAEMDSLNSDVPLKVLEAKKSIISKHDNLFSPTAQRLRALFSFVFALISVLAVRFAAARSVSIFSRIDLLQYVLFFVLFISSTILFSVKDHFYTRKKAWTIVWASLFSSIIIGVLIFAIVSSFEFYSDVSLSSIFVPIISLGFVVLGLFVNYRTKEGNALQGKLLGLRNFILLTEENRLKVLCKENPQMFFSILPFAYVLGVSDVWIKKFENIKLTNPEWFVSDSPNVFGAYIMFSVMNDISRSNVFIPPSSKSHGGGGGFGGHGGGFSGGGFGGGGGRSW